MQNGPHAPLRATRRLTWRIAGLAAIVAVALATVGGGGASGAGDDGNLRSAKVNPTLLEQINANPTGGVTAVITAWGRDGLDDITALGVTGTKLKSVPMIITPALTKQQLDALAGSPAVRSVWPEVKYKVYMEDTTWITKARYVWNTSSSGPATQRGFGVTGQGVELAMIDTGFDGQHEDGDNLIEYCEAPDNATADPFLYRCTPWVATRNVAPAGACGLAYPGAGNTGPGPLYNGAPVGGCRNKARGDSRDPDVSHGTHVGGTMVGTGHASGGMASNHSTIGMAPRARFRAYKAGSASLLNTATLAAYDDMTTKKEDGYSNVIAVNNSWGGGDGGNYDPSDPLSVMVKRAYDAGIVSVFAAGNSGPEHNTLSTQCIIPYVVCVAASTKPDQIVGFSSKGRPSQPQDTNRNGVVGQPGAEEGDANYDPGDIPPDNHDRALGQRLNKGIYRPTLTAPGVNINSMKALGANIGDPASIACRENDGMPVPTTPTSCYVQANGTSMATPHVAGAIGLIGEALLDRNPSRNIRSSSFSAEIIDILERSANTTKLPAWESEEQGVGRLDVHQAVRYARRDITGLTLNRPNMGYPTPPYQNGQYPSTPNATGPQSGANDRFYQEDGCTGTVSWTAKDVVMPVSAPIGIGQPPGAPPQRYGQHFIEVPKNTDRLRITARFAQTTNLTDNMYLRLWRPGVNPDAESATPEGAGRTSAYHQSRVFPDQEAVGLVFTGTERWVEVRSPEESNIGTRGTIPQGRTVPAEGPGEPALNQTPGIPSGTWILRVYHRAGVDDPACNPNSSERPKQTQGHDYTLSVELPGVTYRPNVKIDTSVANPFTTRFVELAGRAGYPPHTQQAPGVEEPTAPPLGNVGYSWEGITNWEVPGSSTGGSGPSVPTVTLYMHGNAEEGCDGNGETDVVGCNGPFLLPKGPDGVKAAFWRTGIDDELFDGTTDRSIHDPNWSWCLAPGDGCPLVAQTGVPAGTQTVSGPMTVEWWAHCNACGGIFSADWFIRVWGDGVLRAEQRVTATPPVLGEPGRVSATIDVPTFTATQRIVVHIDPVYVDSQTVTNIYYDSGGAGNCITAPLSDPFNPLTQPSVTGLCDSLVRMPATAGTGGGQQQNQPPATPANVRVTDLPANPPVNHPYPQNPPLSPALRVAWDAQTPAPARYEVWRSTNPLFPTSGPQSERQVRVYSGPGVPCTSPQAPTPNQPPGHDRGNMAPGTPPALCYTDTGVTLLTTYYYRVVAVRRNQQNTADLFSTNSNVAYGAPTRFDRQVKVKVDRLYGPQYWEHALLPPSPTPPDTTNTGVNWRYVWDTLELGPDEFAVTAPAVATLNPGPPPTVTVTPPTVNRVVGAGHLVFARSFTQGIGSEKDGKKAKLDDDVGPPPPPPGGGCPDDDDGDGDDDSSDGDDSDNGDDSDDDCEDDSDDSESDDD